MPIRKVDSLNKIFFTHYKLALCLITLSIYLALYSTKVLSFDFGDRASIMDAYSKATPSDRNVAELMAKQVAMYDQNNPHHYAPLLKLWCGGVSYAPSPKNLVECAYYRFEMINHLSNPQLSIEALRRSRAEEALIMIQAAIEIAESNRLINESLSKQLRQKYQCYKNLIATNGKSGKCNG